MRRLLAPLFAIVLLPAGLAAQRTPPDPGAPQRPADLGAIKQAPPLTKRISQHEAVTVSLGRVRSDLADHSLSAWSTARGGAVRPASVVSAGALFNPTGGHEGVYVVGVRAAEAKGHVRVVVDAVTGQVLSTRVGTWEWGVSPEWWLKGENSAAPRR